jgi:hypothetical protein
MQTFIQEILEMDSNTVKDYSNGQMDHTIKVIGLKEKSKAEEYMYKMMVEFMMDNGKLIWCMEMVFTNGQMEEDMKEDITKIKSKDTEFIIGLMAEDLKESGVMAREMVQAS